MHNTIYILCPNELVTGGTEALHQMVDAINKQGGDGRIVYVSRLSVGVKRRPPFRFRHYEINVATSVDDTIGNAIVAPEVYPEIMCKYKNATTYFWWLSFDYFSNSKVPFPKNVKHICQSYYAADMIKNEGLIVHQMVTDYITVFPLKARESKRNVIMMPTRKIDAAYQSLHDHILAKYSTIEIRNLSKLALSRSFQKSKLYVDFGIHPGKDRLPREAVYFDAMVLTSKSGSCTNNVDVPLDDQYKITSDISVVELDKRIDNMFNQETQNSVFKNYKKIIQNDRQTFFDEISTVFGLTKIVIGPLESNFRYKYYMYLDHVRSVLRFDERLLKIKKKLSTYLRK